MNIQIKDRNKSYDICLLPYTQLCGTDMRKKRYIIDSLVKYFSNKKYAEYEERYRDNVLVNGKEIGRKYFTVYRIKEKEDMINAIKITKTSMMMEILSDCIGGFDCQNEMEQIAVHLENIYKRINSEIFGNFSNIELTYEKNDIWEILQKSEIMGKEEKDLFELSEMELVDTFISLIFDLQKRKPHKILLIFENIDHMLKKEEYLKVADKIIQYSKKYDIWTLMVVSIEGYLLLAEEFFEGINIVNDVSFSFPEREMFFKYVSEHYPCEVEKSDIVNMLPVIVHKIGNEEGGSNLKANVLHRIINDSLLIKNRNVQMINSMEKSFLLD